VVIRGSQNRGGKGRENILGTGRTELAKIETDRRGRIAND